MIEQPTFEYSARVDLVAPVVDRAAIRRSWRVRTRLESLLASDLITLGDYAAACAFRAAFEHAAGGSARSVLAADGPSGRSSDGWIFSALDG